ncbi:MAG: T9SS type A sorting domain-containing protein [Bacteroidales bacterium]|nr:T9SS type A sorting domain-containing protein [Bacteroidales bacterium]
MTIEKLIRQVIGKASALLITVFLAVAPFTVKAQPEEYKTDQGVLIGTSDSRMFVTVVESNDNVELQVSLTGEMEARAFMFPLVYNPTTLILTDHTYLYDIPDGKSQNQFGSPVISMPQSFLAKYPLYFPIVSYHQPIIDGGAQGMKMFCTSIGDVSGNPVSVILSEGEMIHIYSIFFRKAIPGKALTITDFGYYVQTATVPMLPMETPAWIYGTFSLRFAPGQPWENVKVKPQLFTYRTPSAVTTENTTNILGTTATLNAIFERGAFQPSNNIVVTEYKNLYVNPNHRLNWDDINKYGFIYSNEDATILVKGLSKKLNIDGTDFDFPNATELAAGEFIRNGKTFNIKQENNTATEQYVNYSLNITELANFSTYYAWSLIQYAFETSSDYLNVGEKITFQTTMDPCEVLPVVYVDNFIYCDGEEVEEYAFVGSDDAETFVWKRLFGYDFGLTQTTGTNTIPAFIATNVGFEHVSALYMVTPQNELGCEGEPEYFLITVNPRPYTAEVQDMVYCNGTTAPKFDFTSDTPNAVFEWEFVNEAGSTMIPGIPTSGLNFIPSFEAYNIGNVPLIGKYKVLANYAFDNLTCYDYEWQEFNIIILPTPTVAVVPAEQIINSGETIEDIIFSGSVAEVVFKWERTSGYISEIPALGTGNITGMPILNETLLPISATYKAVAESNYATYPQYKCESNVPAYFTITVNPKLTISPVPDFVYCNGETAPTYQFTGSNPLAVYEWEFVDGDILQGVSTSGINFFPSFVALNTGNNPLVANYKARANCSTCNAQEWLTFSVTVLPTPSVMATPVNQIVCSGQATQPVLFTSNMEGVSFNWKRISGNIPQLPTEGKGNFESYTIINTELIPLEAIYEVTSEYSENNCIGKSTQFSIKVLPVPEVTNSVHAGIICSETLFNYLITTSFPVNEISWKREKHPDINNNEGASGNNAYISEILRNSGASDVVVKYLITLTTGDCIYENITEVSVVVMPEIAFNVAPLTVVCNSEPSVAIAYNTNILGAQYTLIFDKDGIGEGFVNTTNPIPLPESEIVVSIPQGVKEGNYAAILTVIIGQCQKTYPVVISIKGSLVVTNLSEQDIYLCENENLYLFVKTDRDAMYQWYFEGDEIPGATDWYYETIFDAFGTGVYSVKILNECATIDYSFNVHKNSITIERKYNDVLYVDNYGDKYVTYQWYKNGHPVVADGQWQYYTEKGGFTCHAEYYVRAHKADGSYDESCPIVPNDCSGQFIIDMKIYPNPATSGSTITILLQLPDGEQPNATAYMYDMNGKTIAIYQLTDYQTNIIVDCAAGTYLIKIQTVSGKEFIEKLVIYNK